MTRDNFLNPFKTALAKRTGYRCSYPCCDAITVGPSDESEVSVSNTGTAAHIAAASPGKGSRRYDAHMTEEQRASIENGIWCCRDHGTLIDADEVAYSSRMLLGWRAIAEKKAQLRQAHGDIQFAAHPDLAKIGLAPDIIRLGPDFSNSIVVDAVVFSCTAEIWGAAIAGSVRDFLIEHARNVFQHAKATFVSIEFLASGLTVTDDGSPFNLHALATPTFGRGGGLAYRALLASLRINAISTSKGPSNENFLHLPLVRDAAGLLTHNPCALAVSHQQLRLNAVDHSSLANCDRAYVVKPDFMTYSDGPWCEQVLAAALREHLNVILVVPKATNAVLEHFRKRFPQIEIISW